MLLKFASSKSTPDRSEVLRYVAEGLLIFPRAPASLASRRVRTDDRRRRLDVIVKCMLFLGDRAEVYRGSTEIELVPNGICGRIERSVDLVTLFQIGPGDWHERGRE